ncbi:lasso RiPP family leader peptide-containing protein [Streptomyces sp. NBC_01336]|nr:lasso RiPP family leader peptide-containing protein [Streptomyces sp. NBC_01336]
MDDEEYKPYVAPAVSDLGNVTTLTLGTAGFDRADDTQYFD